MDLTPLSHNPSNLEAVGDVLSSIFFARSGYRFSATDSSGIGSQEVNGGTVISNVIMGGVMEYVSRGGLTEENSIGDGSGETVYKGGVASGTVLQPIGPDSAGNNGLYLYSGTAYDTTVLSGEVIENIGGAAYDTVVSSGGTQKLEGGVDLGTLVDAGGTEYLSSAYYSGTGSLETDPLVSGPAATLIIQGGTLDGAEVADGGILETYDSAGTFVMEGSLVFSGGAIVVSQGLDAGAPLLFEGSGNEIEFANLAPCARAISGFGAGDTIGFENYRPTSDTLSFVEAADGLSGTLTIASGSQSNGVVLIGDYATSNFSLMSYNPTSGQTGTLVSYVPDGGTATPQVQSSLHRMVNAIASLAPHGLAAEARPERHETALDLLAHPKA